jgi:hypothetical protein
MISSRNQNFISFDSGQQAVGESLEDDAFGCDSNYPPPTLVSYEAHGDNE